MNTFRILLLSLLAVLPSSISQFAMADAKAVITGPSVAQPGDLVVLDCKASVDRAVHKWILPKGLQGRFIEIDSRLIFATGTQGVYEVGLVVADKAPTVDYVMFEVVIGKSAPPPIDPPTDPPVPPPADPVTWDDVRKFSDTAAQAVDDPPTASKLSAALKALVPQLAAAPDKATATAMAAATIEAVLVARTGESLTKEWLGKWRLPVNEKLREADVAGRMPTQGEFSNAIAAVADGLSK